MGPVVGVLWVVALSLTAPVVLYTLTHLVGISDRVAGLRERRSARRGRDRRGVAVVEPAETSRPFEQVAADVRRLGQRYHGRQVSHVKAESLRHAYDRVLVEACAALDVEHLLSVLPPGADLDQERTRVEGVLHRWGVDLSGLDDAA